MSVGIAWLEELSLCFQEDEGDSSVTVETWEERETLTPTDITSSLWVHKEAVEHV